MFICFTRFVFMSHRLYLSLHAIQVFHDVLLDLRRVVKSSYILNDNICDPFFVLSELCECQVEGGNYRPICYLVGEPYHVTHDNELA